MIDRVEGVRLAAVIVAVTLLNPGCTAHRMYREVSVEAHADYHLAFVEFDDQGELWAPAQLDRALALVESLNRAEDGVALVLFAHGWNTDASPREDALPDGTLSRYRAMLTRLSRGIRQELPGSRVPVVGVYLGWRGRVSSVPLVREASFYNRRGAAERIAGPTATETIYRILGTLRQNPASRSVLVGHSFGSMILERALAQAVVSALLASPGEELAFPTDLVVLLNPAGSGSQAKQLVDILARNRVKTYRLDSRGRRFERPLMVSVTSESDSATRLFFPAGMSVKAWNKKFRREYGRAYCSPISRQRRLYTHTAGHLRALHSHEVLLAPRRGGEAAAMPADRTVPGFLNYEETVDPVTRAVAFSFDGEHRRFTVRRKARALNDTPYWILRAPEELIADHSDVLTEDTFRLIEAILVLSATYDTDSQTLIEREDGVRPVAIAPRPDGTALFLDRGRGVYAVRPDSPRPVFLSCLDETLEPADAVGLHIAGHLAYVVLATRAPGRNDPRCRTELVELELQADGYRQLGRTRIEGSECYSVAAVDVAGKRLFLARADETSTGLRVADLSERSPTPRPFLDLPGDRVATQLLFEAASRRLFSTQAETGEILEIDVDAVPPALRRIDPPGLETPTALGYSRTDSRLYVTDAGARAIWAFDCSGSCRDPSVFARSESLGHPTTLVVALDGTLWLGDLRGQTITTVAPDGSRGLTIHRLSGTPRP